MSPCGTSISGREFVIEMPGWELTIYDAQGNLHPTVGGTTWPYLISGRPGCDLVIDTNGGGGSHSDVAIDQKDVAVFEFCSPLGTTCHRFVAGVAFDSRGANHFYAPNWNGPTSSTDGDFYVTIGLGGLRISPEEMWDVDGEARYFDEFFPDDSWVMPYEYDAICDGLGALASDVISCYDRDRNEKTFFTPQANWPNPTSSPTYQFSGLVDIVRPANTINRWNVPGMTLEFSQGRHLVLEGELEAEGVTFTAAVPSQGWGGVRFRPGSIGTMTGVIVEDATGILQHGFDAAVEVDDATVTLSGSFIQDGTNVHGLWAYGDDALVTLDQLSAIEDMGPGGTGIRASSGAEVRVYDSTVQGNVGTGIGATGAGTRIYLAKSTVSSNGVYGVIGELDGVVTFRRHDDPTPGSGVTVSSNARGGLYGGRGTITAGLWNPTFGYCIMACQNRILDNWQGSNDFDAKALGSGVVSARYNDWGEMAGVPRTEQDLELVETFGGAIYVTPIWDGSSARMGGASAPPAFGEDLLASTPGPSALVDEAYTARAMGDAAAAGAALLAALQRAATPDEWTLAYGVAGRFLAHTSDVESQSARALEAFLEARAASVEETRPWALSALLSAHVAQGQTEEGWRIAEALTTEYGETEHALPGLAATVRLAVEAGDLASAQAALAALEARWPDWLATESAAARVRRLQEADSAAGADERAGQPAVQATGAQTGAAVTEAPAGFRLLGARPNPFLALTAVPFEVAAPSRVRVAVYDVLGREVAVLADGPHGPGRYEAVFDGRGLPPGVYLVRARVESESGARRSAVERITLLR